MKYKYEHPAKQEESLSISPVSGTGLYQREGLTFPPWEKGESEQSYRGLSEHTLNEERGNVSNTVIQAQPCRPGSGRLAASQSAYGGK